MTLSRWDVKRLIKALDLAIEVQGECLTDGTRVHEFARLRRDRDHWRVLRRDLQLALANWKKNSRLEL